MNDSTHLLVKRTILVSAMSLFGAAAQADVKSLSSNELTETYIKDSTIIVTPKKQAAASDEAVNKKLSSITISPGDAPVSDEEKQYEFEKNTLDSSNQLNAAIANAEDRVREAALSVDQAALGTIQPTIPEIVFANPRPTLPGVVIPEGDFNMSFVGNDLGLSRTGDQVTFSFGNLPGVDTINVPNGINGDSVQLIPRQGGGFDLVIDIPK